MRALSCFCSACVFVKWHEWTFFMPSVILQCERFLVSPVPFANNNVHAKVLGVSPGFIEKNSRLIDKSIRRIRTFSWGPWNFSPLPMRTIDLIFFCFSSFFLLIFFLFKARTTSPILSRFLCQSQALLAGCHSGVFCGKGQPGSFKKKTKDWKTPKYQ